MNEASTSQRLEQCFQAVFPGIPPSDIATTTTDSVSDWDSVAQVTLISVVEEEFAVIIPEEKYGDLLSFQAWSAFLEPLQG